MRLRLTLLSALVLTACASGGDGGGGRLDSGMGGRIAPDASPSEDAGPTEDANLPRVDGGMSGCGPGQHACGAGCVDDLANEPANGCRLGCGEPCPTPPDGTASCSADGMCSSGECEPPAMLVDGECVCTPMDCDGLGAMCGAPDDGCGTPLDCGTCADGGTCVGGSCGCMPDMDEANGSRAEADARPFLAVLNDSDDDEVTFTMFTIDSAADEDWYRVDVEDGADGGAPVIEVELSGIPSGSNYDLSAFWTCDEGTPGEDCDAGMPDSELGFGCSSNSSGTTSELVIIDSWCGMRFSGDPGVLYVRVRPATVGGTCEPYTLRIKAR
ncbi:MAG: hypothetical protein AB8I08_38755 [Sandaracinaceae bacterium]